jgi:hypothetical protein
LGHGLQKLLGGGKARLVTGKIRPSSLSRHWQKMVYRPNAEEIFGGFGQKTVFAPARSKSPVSSNGLKSGRMHPAIHGQTGRSGCTPAEPYPPSRDSMKTKNKKKKTISQSPVDKPHTRNPWSPFPRVKDSVHSWVSGHYNRVRIPHARARHQPRKASIRQNTPTTARDTASHTDHE